MYLFGPRQGGILCWQVWPCAGIQKKTINTIGPPHPKLVHKYIIIMGAPRERENVGTPILQICKRERTETDTSLGGTGAQSGNQTREPGLPASRSGRWGWVAVTLVLD